MKFSLYQKVEILQVAWLLVEFVANFSYGIIFSFIILLILLQREIILVLPRDRLEVASHLCD